MGLSTSGTKVVLQQRLAEAIQRQDPEDAGVAGVQCLPARGSRPRCPWIWICHCALADTAFAAELDIGEQPAIQLQEQAASQQEPLEEQEALEEQEPLEE
jgi:hypothetical protein